MATHEDLLRQRDWLVRLARRLVDDATLADDVAHDALLQAMRHRDSIRAARSWLATVARRLARDARRRAARQSVREASVAPPESLPSTADVVSRASLHHTVVEAVLCLREPYRATVLMRYYDDLPPRKIAAQLGVPVSTVETHVQRGLRMLRTELDRYHAGDRQVWLQGLVVLARPEPLEVLGLSTSTWTALALATVVGTGIVVWRRAPPSPDRPVVRSNVVEPTPDDPRREEKQSDPPRRPVVTTSTPPRRHTGEPTPTLDVEPDAATATPTPPTPSPVAVEPPVEERLVSGEARTGRRYKDKTLGALFAEHFAGRKSNDFRRYGRTFEKLERELERCARELGIETLLARPDLLRGPIATPFEDRPTPVRPGFQSVSDAERLMDGELSFTYLLSAPSIEPGLPVLLALPPLHLDEAGTLAYAESHIGRDLIESAVIVVPVPAPDTAAWTDADGLMRTFFPLRRIRHGLPVDWRRIILTSADPDVVAKLACDYPAIFAGAIAPRSVFEVRPDVVNAEHMPVLDASELDDRAVGFVRSTVKATLPATVHLRISSPDSVTAWWLHVHALELGAGSTVEIEARADRAKNEIHLIAPPPVRGVTLYLNDDLLDLDRPLRVLWSDGPEQRETCVYEGVKHRRLESLLANWFVVTGSLGEVFVAEVTVERP